MKLAPTVLHPGYLPPVVKHLPLNAYTYFFEALNYTPHVMLVVQPQKYDICNERIHVMMGILALFQELIKLSPSCRNQR